MALRALSIVILCLGFIGGDLHANAASVDESPNKAEVEQHLVSTLPSYWKLDDVALVGPVNYGTRIEPDLRWRFEAVIAPKEPLFVDGGRRGSVVLLQLYLGPESRETLYGIIKMTFRAGRWIPDIQHENRPFDYRGQTAATHKLAALETAEAELHAISTRIFEARQAALRKLSKAEKLEAATHKLAALETAEAELHAISTRIFEARQAALRKLFEALGAVSEIDSYRALIETVGESGIDWKLEAVLHYGFASGNLTIREAAWIHLLRADLEGNARLRTLLLDNLDDLKKHPRLRMLALANMGKFKDSTQLRMRFLDLLPSLEQWATRVVDASSYYSTDTGPQWALGATERGYHNRCNSDSGGIYWTTEQADRGEEFIRVAYAKPVLLPQINVHELSNIGFVRKLILWDPEGGSTEYQVLDGLSSCPGTAEFRLYEHTSPVQEVTVMIDTKHKTGHEKITAIKLIGIPFE